MQYFISPPGIIDPILRRSDFRSAHQRARQCQCAENLRETPRAAAHLYQFDDSYSGDAPLPTLEDSPCEPTSYYGITKWAGERYVHATAARRDLDFTFQVTAFRMYNVYGPRQALDNPYQGVLGIFIGKPTPVICHRLPTPRSEGRQEKNVIVSRWPCA